MSETRLSVRMSPSEIEHLKQFAASQNMTLADWVRATLLTKSEMHTDRIGELERRLALLESKVA